MNVEEVCIRIQAHKSEENKENSILPVITLKSNRRCSCQGECACRSHLREDNVIIGEVKKVVKIIRVPENLEAERTEALLKKYEKSVK